MDALPGAGAVGEPRGRESHQRGSCTAWRGILTERALGGYHQGMADIPHAIRVAVHEAGHAVVSCILGLPSGRVAIGPKPIAYNYCDGAIRSIITALAGRAAEDVILGGPLIENGIEQGSESDDKHAADLLDCNGFWASARLFPMDEARRLVARHRVAVERVAAALLIEGMLTGEQVDDLMC